VEHWDLSNDSANTAVNILRVNMYWSIILVVLGMESTSQSETLANSKYSIPVTTKGRNFLFKPSRENLGREKLLLLR
jgi:hypothetical protein